MEILVWLRSALHVIPTSLIETPLFIGLAIFAITWLRRAPWIALPHETRRRALLVRLGTFGPLAVAIVGVTVGAIAAFSGYDSTGVAGWWRRPATMATAAIAIGIAAILLAREPLPAPGERAIAPRRHWWSLTPRPQLWWGIVASVLLALTSVWQGFTTSLLTGGGPLLSLPTADGGLEIRQVDPSEQDIPVGPFVDTPAGGGWLNNGVTLLVLLALVAVLVLSLSRDANRPVPATASAPRVLETRETTARVFVLIALGGTIITLGMLWMYVGFLGGWQVTVETPEETASLSVPVGTGFVGLRTGYAAFADIFRFGGWLLQGLGVAILLRLACDTWRAARRTRGATPDAPAPVAEFDGATEAAR